MSFPQPQLGDEKGTNATSGFSGSGTPDGYQGVLTPQQPLYRDTRWISVGGVRIDLPDGDGIASAVTLEELPERPPALDYLWRSVAPSGRPMPVNEGGIAAAIEALAVVGAIDPDSAEIAQIRQVAAITRVPWHPQFHRHQPSALTGTSLPEPWASLTATRRRSGPGGEGTTVVGGVTPPIDGRFTVIVGGMSCFTDGFSFDVGVRPGVALGVVGELPGDESSTLHWWAKDDRGGVYLGGPSNWGGGIDHADGTITFGPGIDRKCRQLKLMPTGRRQRAVIAVTLPWSSPR